jgi:hypothetical protein
MLSFYFYYKTGCQVLFVKKYAECLEAGVSRIGITSGSDGGSPTALLKKLYPAVAAAATSQKA